MVGHGHVSYRIYVQDLYPKAIRYFWLSHYTHSKHHEIGIWAEILACGSKPQPGLLLCCSLLPPLVNSNNVLGGYVIIQMMEIIQVKNKAGGGRRTYTNEDYLVICLAQLSRCSRGHCEEQDWVRVIWCSAASLSAFPTKGSVWGSSTLSLKDVTQLMSFDGAAGLFFPRVSPDTINEL